MNRRISAYTIQFAVKAMRDLDQKMQSTITMALGTSAVAKLNFASSADEVHQHCAAVLTRRPLFAFCGSCLYESFTSRLYIMVALLIVGAFHGFGNIRVNSPMFDDFRAGSKWVMIA